MQVQLIPIHQDGRRPNSLIVRAELLVVAAWTCLAAWAHGSLALTSLPLAPVIIALMPRKVLVAWELKVLGPILPPTLQQGDPNRRVEILRQLRHLEQIHYDRLCLLITVIMLLVATDLRFSSGQMALYQLLPLSLVFLLIRRIIAAVSISRLTDDVAEIAWWQLPSRSSLPPLRIASLSASIAMGLGCLAWLVVTMPSMAVAGPSDRLLLHSEPNCHRAPGCR